MKDMDQHQKDLNQAAMSVLETLQDKEEQLQRLIDNEKKPAWVNLSWAMERDLVSRNISQITKDIINQSYNY